jgi:ParB family chromosome partitioning protein
MSKVAAKRPSVFDAIVEKGQENAARLEETFTGPIVELATSYIRPNPNNPRRRIPQSSVDEMANAIRQVGEILQPLLVRPTAPDDDGYRYEIVCGDRRLLGARQENLPKVPVRVRELSDEDAARFALWENLARKDLDAMDVADSVDRLRHIDRLTWPELAARFGVSKQWVWKLQKMAELPEAVKDMVRDRRLSAYSATLLTQVTTGEADVVAFAHEIVDKKLSTREVERLLEERRGGPDPADRKGAFTVSWTPPPGYQGRSHSRVIRAAEDLVASIRDGKITPDLARSLQPVAQALIDIGGDPPGTIRENAKEKEDTGSVEGPG